MSESCYYWLGLCFSNKIDLALIVTILIFAATLRYNAYAEREKERKSRRRYLVALKEEIALNLRGLRNTIASWPPRESVCEFLKADKKNRPLMTFTYYSTIYKNRTEVLEDLPDVLINSIVDFYGKLADLEVDVGCIESKAFETVSHGGREQAFFSLLEKQQIALQQGETILSAVALELRQN